jgi:PAS domain S-box-containing protein
VVPSSRFGPNGTGTDHPQISLAYLPPTPRQTRTAFAGAAVLLLGLAVLIAFAAKPLPKVNGFIPAFDAIISVADLITAGLLLAHFSITRSRAIRALACGYLFSGAIVVVHALTFPGAFSPTGNLFGGSHTNFRIYLLWHLGLPVALFAYVWLRDKDRTKTGAHTPTEIVATVGGVGVFALISCIAVLALLPPVDPVAGRWLTVITMLICAAALSVLWVFRRSALDQWLMVVVLAMIVELAITGLIGGLGPHVTVTFGFYIGRLFSLVTSTVVLIALLAETSKLYAGVARANMLAGIVNISRALSSEIVLPKLIERLMKSAIENADADRGLLILPSESGYLIRAEGRATGDRVEVALREDPITGTACPESLIRHVIRRRERVILDDASSPNLFSGDDYLRDRRSKSILCLPLIKQGELTGIFLLENTLTSQAFTPARIAVLELLTAQAAISLENASLYSDVQLLAGLLQRLPVSAWTLKPDGSPDFVNQVWLEYSGQTVDFIQSHPEAWMTAVHPEDREAASRAFWDGVRSGQGFTMETRSLRARDGTYRWHLQQAVVLRDTEGKVLKFIGTTTDIDDQKRAEEESRANELRLREMTETIPEMLWSATPEGAIDYCNTRFLKYTGFSAEEVMGYGWQRTIHPDDSSRAGQVWMASVRTGTLYQIEVRTFHAADRTYRWCLVSALPLLDQQGRILKWHGTIVDIHDHKLAEEALRQAQGDLARINRVTTMGELAASLAHELSQPISGAITNANVCLRKLAHDKPDFDEVRTTVTRIGRDAQRAAEIIVRIRSQFEKGSPTPQTLDVNEIIPETITLLRDEAARYGIAVRTELAPDLPQIVGDRVQLQQVAMNLIVNSIEAIKENDGMREIVIQSQRGENEQILVSFTDTGMGLPPQLAAQIFEPFFTTKTHGTGMGLRISRSIIESHGGRLWVESVAGRGATFHLSLPVSTPGS